MKLCSRFNCRATTVAVAEQRRRTAAELLAAAKMRAKDRRMEENRKAAREKAEQERLAAITREKHLDSVAGRVPELWRQIDETSGDKQPKSYDLVMQHLLDLRDLAKRRGKESDFAKQVSAL